MELWERAQAKLKANGRAGRPLGYSKTVYLLSGLLKCGQCGGAMSVVSRQKKNGKQWAMFGCSSARKNGPTTCSNKLMVSERKATKIIIETIRDTLLERGLVEQVIDSFNARVAAGLTPAAGARTLAAVEQEIATAERRVANVAAAVAEVGLNEALRQQLRQEQDRLERLKTERQALQPLPVEQQVHVHPKKLEKYVSNLMNSLEANPELGRTILTKHLEPVVLSPKLEGGERYYEAAGNFSLDPVDLSVHRASTANQGCGGHAATICGPLCPLHRENLPRMGGVMTKVSCVPMLVFSPVNLLRRSLSEPLCHSVMPSCRRRSRSDEI